MIPQQRPFSKTCQCFHVSGYNNISWRQPQKLVMFNKDSSIILNFKNDPLFSYMTNLFSLQQKQLTSRVMLCLFNKNKSKIYEKDQRKLSFQSHQRQSERWNSYLSIAPLTLGKSTTASSFTAVLVLWVVTWWLWLIRPVIFISLFASGKESKAAAQPSYHRYIVVTT